VKQIVILSGKGGTGKTTVAAALAHLASQEASLVLADADVDAANLELVLAPTKLEEHDFVGGKVAVIDPELCTACGICAEVCRFEAVVVEQRGGGVEVQRSSLLHPCAPAPPLKIDPIACEGCAVCYYQCPVQAIRLEEPVAGQGACTSSSTPARVRCVSSAPSHCRHRREGQGPMRVVMRVLKKCSCAHPFGLSLRAKPRVRESAQGRASERISRYTLMAKQWGLGLACLVAALLLTACAALARPTSAPMVLAQATATPRHARQPHPHRWRCRLSPLTRRPPRPCPCRRARHRQRLRRGPR